MKNFKKFLTLVLAVMMVVSCFAFSTSAATTKFEDVDADNEALVEAVDLLAYMGITKGKSDTSFGADEKVTREQFALFMYRLMKGGKDAPAGASNTTKFTDLEDSTYFYAISWANATGIVNGKSATSFGPKDGIKLQEAYAMIVRALEWEVENDLVYPFGHIEIAEQDGVELDKNLDSSLNYADELTRGDMAILLYNAFFAETGIEETETYIRSTQTSADKDKGEYTFTFIEDTYRPVLCVKKFDAAEVYYQAVGTPYYTLGKDAEATYDLGYDAIYFTEYATAKRLANPSVKAPAAAFIEAEDIRLEGENLDDYFLGVFHMYVLVDEDDQEITKVLYSDCDMNKKTVNDLVLGEVSSNKEKSYYTQGGPTDAKLLSGKVTADGEDMYFYNAPYSYLKPTYENGADAESKYEARNANNLKNVEFAIDDTNKNDDVTLIKAEVSNIFDNDRAEYDAEGFFRPQAAKLVKEYDTVYYGGLHEADLYDVNGDGIYDYIDYKPYSFFQVDSDEDEEYEDDQFDDAVKKNKIPYIYTNEAYEVVGEFADEDYVIGYVDTAMDTVKVVEVVKPTVDVIDNFKKSNGTLTLGNGDKVDATSAYRLLNNIKPLSANIVFDTDTEFGYQVAAASDLFDAKVLEDDEYEFYIYNGVLLHHEEVDNNYKFTENLIIPTMLDETYVASGDKEEVNRLPENAFDVEAGKVWYIYAWVDGKMKYVPVVTEDVEPKLIKSGKIAPEYLDMLCTYSVDEDGVYTIKSLGYAMDNDPEEKSGKKYYEYEGVNKDMPANGEFDTDKFYENYKDYEGLKALEDDEDENIQYYVDGVSGKNAITKVAGSRFELKGFAGTVDVKSYTKIIIRVWDKKTKEFTYNVYDAASFKKSLEDDVVLENMSYILSNNPNSKKRENLVVLYAETEDVRFKGELDKDSFRIVSGQDYGEDEDGLWRFYYELYDPTTGAKVTEVPGTQAVKKARDLNAKYSAGEIIVLEDGMVNDKKSSDGKNYLGKIADKQLLVITEVDEAEGYFGVVPAATVTGLTCKDCIVKEIEDLESRKATIYDCFRTEKGSTTAAVIPSNFINYDKNTVVAVLSKSNETSLWEYGSMSLSSMDAIASGDESVLSWNNKADAGKNNYKKGYADYVTAYVSTVDETLEADEQPTAAFVLVVATGESNMAKGIKDCTKTH